MISIDLFGKNTRIDLSVMYKDFINLKYDVKVLNRSFSEIKSLSSLTSLTSVHSVIESIKSDTFKISEQLNLTTFTYTKNEIGINQMNIEEWMTSPGDTMNIYNVENLEMQTLGFGHTIDESCSLGYYSSLLSQWSTNSTFSVTITDKSCYYSLEDNVFPSSNNIGIYPWTKTTYEGYVFKYDVPHTNLIWDIPTLPTNVESITYSFTFTDSNVGVNPTLYLTNMNNVEYFNFNNTTNYAGYFPISGSYVLSFNTNQQIGTMDLINGPAARFLVKKVKANELNYSALSSKSLLLDSVTCPNVNILSPCSTPTLSYCELNNINGNSAVNLSLQYPKMINDLNIESFNNISLLSIESTEPKKDININSISSGHFTSIKCKNLNVDNAKGIRFTANTYNLDIDNIKLNNVPTGSFSLASAAGMIGYAEFKNMSILDITAPTATTFFTNGGLIEDVERVYMYSGTVPNFTIKNSEIQECLELSEVTISGGELTVGQLKGQTCLIKDIENININFFYSCTSFTFDGIENLTISNAIRCTNNSMRNVSHGFFNSLPSGFDQGMSVNSWHVDSVNSTYINWLSNEYMNVSSMTIYTGTNGWFGGFSTFIGDNLYNASSSGNYTIKNVNDITINNLSFTGSNSISFEDFNDLDIEKMNNNVSNSLTINGSNQIKLKSGTVRDLVISNTQNISGLTLSNFSFKYGSFTNISVADFGNLVSCNEVMISNVLNCVNPINYAINACIDYEHAENLSNYVKSWLRSSPI